MLARRKQLLQRIQKECQPKKEEKTKQPQEIGYVPQLGTFLSKSQHIPFEAEKCS